ncbi:sigma-70 family RNA polymerase sigma factor [Bacillus sp. FJAT-49736]|uniref:RNA polymerase sigma factor n=1 Tax=Bacillus sp. FJAT-49736 TaxID=2833582 RepID=UPI001BC8F5FF|nr:sigma-70 family RNA polymerase sigma factor [Bacillus sp. FJAT-49736]MBS4175134.1 sigma-70 family RNA polymerase sigma factor [Bacillus sp. FJAT-49736]
MNWETIWRDHWKEIYLYIYNRTHNKEEAEDLTQETFMKAIKSEGRYKDQDVTVIALLKTIARNLIIDRWRNTQKRPVTTTIEQQNIVESVEKSPEELLTEKEEIRYALSLLNEDQQQIITHRILQGYSIKKTAEILGKTESFIKVNQFRAIEFIRNHIKKENRRAL